MKILVMCGSPRKQANTRILARAVEDLVRDRNIDLLSFDVRHDRLPLFEMDEEGGPYPALVKLRNDARAADGMVICTPEYHNGISGALKNALDFLGSDVFAEKGIVILASSGGGKGGINALNQLRLIMRSLSGYVLPGQFIVDPDDVLPGDPPGLRHECRSRLAGLVEQLVQFTAARMDVVGSRRRGTTTST